MRDLRQQVLVFGFLAIAFAGIAGCGGKTTTIVLIAPPATPSSAPTLTPTTSPTASRTPTSTPPIPTPTPTVGLTPTLTPTPAPTPTSTSSSTGDPTQTPTPTPAPTPTVIPGSGTIYVANHPQGLVPGSVTEYAPGSNGDVAPIATISGPHTGLNAPQGIALDARGNIYVGAHFENGTGGIDGRVTIYPAGSNGDVAPIATISGPNTGLDSRFIFGIALDPVGNIYALTNERPFYDNPSVNVYAPGSNGNVAPIATISGSNTALDSGYGLTVDSNGNTYVLYQVGATAEVWVYAPGSHGNEEPSATISGSSVGLIEPHGIAVDSNGKIYVSDSGSLSIKVYAPGSNGNVAPIATIKGSNTGISGLYTVALDSNANIYVVAPSVGAMPGELLEYAAGSNGNVAPIATISGPHTGLDLPQGIAIGR